MSISWESSQLGRVSSSTIAVLPACATSGAEQALNLDPVLAQAAFERGVGYARNRLYDRAIAEFTNALQLNPRDAASYYNRGTARASRRSVDVKRRPAKLMAAKIRTGRMDVLLCGVQKRLLEGVEGDRVEILMVSQILSGS